jgi:hypothetical protein
MKVAVASVFRAAEQMACRVARNMVCCQEHGVVLLGTWCVARNAVSCC